NINHRFRGNRLARRCYGDQWARQRASQNSLLRRGKMLRGGCKTSERRRHLSDQLSWQQDQALSSSIYLLREIGPTGFLLREEEPENRDFRVTTAPNSPSLAPPPTRGLVEGEINDLLRGIHRIQTPQIGMKDENVHVEDDGYIKQKEIGSEDICPICQEVLLEKKLPVTFCRFGCGNSVHIKCMKILTNYQDMISNTSMLKCPLCRKEFAPLKLILEEFKNSSKLLTTAEKERLDRHLGIPCNNCKQFPVEGKCYNQVYTPKHVVKALPLLLVTKNSKLLAPGYQCRLCLKAFCLGQYTRLLPCAHKFHRNCIDSWLFHKCNSCPIDGQVIFNPLIWKDTAVNGHSYPPISSTAITHLSKEEEPELFIPGTRLVLKQNRHGILPRIPQCNSEKLSIPPSPTETYQNIKIDELNSIKSEDSNSRKLIYEYKIIQHFPRYLQDLPTRSNGKISSQTFLPSIAHKNIICPTGMESSCISEKLHSGQSPKMSKDCKSNSKLKNKQDTKLKDDAKKSSTLLSEDLNLTV
ncbi:E3 ubiquitin-protein ligase ZSWIM2, partial [Galemys pyrenaicus]